MGKPIENPANIKLVKEKLRRSRRKKIQKERKKQKAIIKPSTIHTNDKEESQQITLDPIEIDNDVEVEYVERDEYLLTGKFYEEFKNVFQYFSTPKYETEQTKGEQEEENEVDNDVAEKKKKKKKIEEQVLSRKKRKQLKMLKVAQLKALVKRPDVVEAWDVTSPDPLSLVYLKSYKNTVPVPRHWCQKRKFLQNKRGILKPPFKLPPFIEATGIARLRDPLTDADGGKMVRQKLKERMNPKMGKIDIDYEILHDAFFKHQVKPKLSSHGDIYYEGKEDEVKMKSYRPGKISDELRQALGISDFAAPPWIINMQRYGPPPSYPNLKIPGLNTPIPESGNYSFLYNKPEESKFNFFADPYNTSKPDNMHGEEDNQKLENFLWGELIEEEEEEEIDEAPIENYGDTANIQKSETETKSGISSIISGLETPNIDIRKQTKPTGKVEPKVNTFDTSGKPLYQILEPVQLQAGEGIFGSTHGYIIPGNEDPGKDLEKKRNDNINFKF